MAELLCNVRLEVVNYYCIVELEEAGEFLLHGVGEFTHRLALQEVYVEAGELKVMEVEVRLPIKEVGGLLPEQAT